MFDDKNNINSDLLMRSILENGQEEVPARVWDKVAAGLDASARRKKVALWWRRSTVAGTVAAAAAVAAVLFLNPAQTETDIIPAVPAGSDMIAVVTDTQEEEKTNETALLIAEARQMTVKKTEEVVIEDRPALVEEHAELPVETAAEVPADEETVAAAEPSKNEETVESEQIRFPEDWGEDEYTEDRKAKTSIVISGLTGTNNPQANGGKSLMKRPSLTNSPLKTGVKETSTKSTYGVPVSFGAGVKFEFTPKWSLSAGINYSMLPRTFYGTYTKVTDGSVESSVSSDIRNTQHYIGIPVNVYYDILGGDNVNFYAYAGGTVEKCVSDRYEILSTSVVHKNNPSGVQLSANAGIGVEFMLGKHLGLYLDPSLRYYFNCNQPKSIRTVQPLTLGFEMGLRVNL